MLETKTNERAIESPPESNMCSVCLSKGIKNDLIEGTCPICGPSKPAGHLVRYDSADYSSDALMNASRDKAELVERIAATIIKPGTLANRKMEMQAAEVMAHLALAHGLDPHNREIYAIPVVEKQGKESKIVGFVPYVGIYGRLRSASRQGGFATKDIHFYSGQEDVEYIKRYSTLTCNKCKGKGVIGSKGWNCFACGGTQNKPGKGELDPDEILICVIEAISTKKLQDIIEANHRIAELNKMQKEAGGQLMELQTVKYTTGIGIFFHGDQVPSNKDPRWVAQKRATGDFLDKEFSLTFAGLSPRLKNQIEEQIQHGQEITLDKEEVEEEGMVIEGAFVESSNQVMSGSEFMEWKKKICDQQEIKDRDVMANAKLVLENVDFSKFTTLQAKAMEMWYKDPDTRKVREEYKKWTTV